MSIPVPNYTQIPNVIFDHWMKVLNPSEFTILMCLCRKTFGWHKASDRISKNQLMKATGLSKITIQSSLESLEAHRLLSRIQRKNEYGFEPNEYRLNIHKPEDVFLEEIDQNLGVGRSKDDPGVGQRMTQGVGQSLTPQKKDITKEKEKIPPDPLKGEPAPKAREEKKPSNEGMEIAQELWSRIRGVHPKAKEPKLSEWALEMDRAMKIDSRSKEELLEVIRYVFEKDTFWAGVLQSADSLRRNFDKIWIKCHGTSKASAPVTQTSEEKNKLFSEKLKKYLASLGHTDVEVGYTYLELRSGNYHLEHIAFNEHGLQERALNWLRKRNIDAKGLDLIT